VGVIRSFSLAPLVAAAFLSPGPPGAILKHRDGDHSNCAADNLRWAPKLDPETRGGRRRKLSADQEAEVLCLRGVLSSRAVARRFGVSQGTICLTWKRGE
jgi:hypothetical protein